ncbi:MAG: hypothetical protein KDA81_16080 [Planctomycetaceae bacterium]|nr:hypothetical protein [Planctomycetaceae bacterium]
METLELSALAATSPDVGGSASALAAEVPEDSADTGATERRSLQPMVNTTMWIATMDINGAAKDILCFI